jgi:predicted phosphoribosyltransferase
MASEAINMVKMFSTVNGNEKVQKEINDYFKTNKGNIKFVSCTLVNNENTDGFLSLTQILICGRKEKCSEVIKVILLVDDSNKIGIEIENACKKILKNNGKIINISFDTMPQKISTRLESRAVIFYEETE